MSAPGDDEPVGDPNPRDTIRRAVTEALAAGSAAPGPEAPAATPDAPAGKADEADGPRERRRRGDPRVAREPRRPSAKSGLLGLADECEIWHARNREAFVTFPFQGHSETWPLKSDPFKDWLAARSSDEFGAVPSETAISDILRVLRVRSFETGAREPWRRTGEDDGRIFVDLCDADWRVVEITPRGWTVVGDHGRPFLRSPSMLPLPEPEPGGMIEELRRFINVESDDDFVLVVAWMVAALRPRGPYPILVVNGEQGAGKSIFSRLVRSLVDPNEAPIRLAPRDDRDLVVTASNAHALVIDNISRIEPWLSDALCRLATGGGFATRALHTDRDEMVLTATRPIILDGIPMLTERADLADRAVTVRLRSFGETERRPEDEFMADWEASRPRILGALCDAVAIALRRVGEVRLVQLPRMADFAKWSVAAEPALGCEPGEFLRAYRDNRRDVSDTTFEADQVAIAIFRLMSSVAFDQSWEGTATELLTRLNDIVPEAARRMRTWPVTAQALGNRLDRVAPLLRGRGIVLVRRHSGTRLITIARMAAA